VTTDGLTVEADGTHIYLKQTNGDYGHQFRQANDGGALQIGRNVNGTFTEAMRISGGNLLVGTTSTSLVSTSTETGAQIYDGGFVAAANDPVAYFNRITSEGSIAQFRKDGSLVGSIGVGNGSSYTYIGTGDTGLMFNSGNDFIQPWNPSTNANKDNGTDLGRGTSRWKNLFLSGGVYLGGTGSANLLDHYEEGTWTPAVSGSTTTFSTSTSNGTYTKVGRLVTLSCSVMGITGSDTGYLRVTGVPFTKRSSGTNFQGTVRLESFNWPAGYTWCVPEFTTSGSTNAFYFRLLGDNLSGQDLDSSYVTSGSARFFATITYETT